MKYRLKNHFTILIVFAAMALAPVVRADGGLIAYYKVAVIKGSMDEVATMVNNVLTASVNSEGQLVDPFLVLGEYSPAKDLGLRVITFSRPDLMQVVGKLGDRGAMAAILKVGLRELIDKRGNPSGDIEVSLLNPDYLFYAYLRDNIDNSNENILSGISEDVKMALLDLEHVMFFPFVTSSLSENELKDFRYMVRMPSFDEPVELTDFSNFHDAVKVVNQNLHGRKGGTYRVYAILPSDFPELPQEREGDFHRLLPAGSNTAVFGVGLLDQRIGESKFLAELGDAYIAAMPYELIIQDNEATILHGRYRFPLFWSDLTMADYRKIYKTPRDVEETMRGLTVR